MNGNHSLPDTPMNTELHNSEDAGNFLAGYAPHIQAIALRLRTLVLELAPSAIEQIDLPARLLAYGFARTYKDTLSVIMPLKNAVNLGFPEGTSLFDPDGLLAGTGKRARHVRITDISQTENPSLRAMLIQAIKLRGG